MLSAVLITVVKHLSPEMSCELLDSKALNNLTLSVRL